MANCILWRKVILQEYQSGPLQVSNSFNDNKPNESIDIAKLRNFISLRFSCKEREDVKTSSRLLGTLCKVGSGCSSFCKMKICSRSLNSRYWLILVFARHVISSEEQ